MVSSNGLVLYQVNFNVLAGTSEYWLEQMKYVRFCCYRNSSNIEFLYCEWQYIINYYLTDFGYKNYARQFAYKVEMSIPRVHP